MTVNNTHPLFAATELDEAVAIRFVIEWEGGSQNQLDTYLSHVRDVASVMTRDQLQFPTDNDLQAEFGRAFLPYAQLVARDIGSFRSSGTIPMTPLCESGL